MTNEFECPVCKEGFGNEGGLAAHLSLTKDAAHHAHRSGSTLLPAPNPTNAPEQPDASGYSGESGSGRVDPPVSPVGATHPTRPLDQPDPLPDPTPNPTRAAPLIPEIVTFERPLAVGPLLPDAGSGGPDGSKAPPKVEVSLEPFIEQSLSVLTNGFFLTEKTDDKLRPEEVRDSGFSRAAEACLSHYLPQLPKDHPLTALVVSGATLAFIIVQKKGALKPDATRPEPARAQPDPTHPPVTNPDPATRPEPEPTRPNGSTGEAYWDAILRRAQGGPRRGDDDD